MLMIDCFYYTNPLIVKILVVLLLIVKILLYNVSTYLYNTASFITMNNYVTSDEIRSANFSFVNVSSRIFL